MKELQAILQAFEEAQHRCETSFLATVINTEGSTYRRPKAKMLMTDTGKIVGAISGGCLENDVFEYTRQKMSSGKPIVVTYDTTADEDLVLGFGIGCNGVVEVLIEPLDVNNRLNPLNFIQECFCDRQRGIIATVFSVEGSLKVKLGERLILAPEGKIDTDIKESNLLQAIAADAKAALRTQKSTINEYQLSPGKIKVFIEIIQPPMPLLIFGSGRDAVPVVNLAKNLGWHVTVVDCRANEATRDRFHIADRVIFTRRDIVDRQVHIDTDTVAVVMTHNYHDDLEIMKMLLPSSAKYIGVLGSKQRTARLLQELSWEDKQPEQLYFPIGIDIGAETPEEIALAIIAEIQAVLANRSSGFLKNRQEPIHQQIKLSY